MKKTDLKILIKEVLNELSPELLKRASVNARIRGDTRGQRLHKKFDDLAVKRSPDLRIYLSAIPYDGKLYEIKHEGDGYFWLSFLYKDKDYPISIDTKNRRSTLDDDGRKQQVFFDRKSAVLLSKHIKDNLNITVRPTDFPLD